MAIPLLLGRVRDARRVEINIFVPAVVVLAGSSRVNSWKG
jgi:hypothetical protein